jgi:exosortase/archaeosortase family protein
MPAPLSYDEFLERQRRTGRLGPVAATLLFLAVFVLLQAAWGVARGTQVERAVIDQATVHTARFLIRLIEPSLPVAAEGSRLKAPGGGINILNGCEGTEVLFLLYAALAAAAMPWRGRILGALVGTLLVFALNQGRVVALFYAYRSDRAMFDLMHGTVAPLVLIALTLLFFVYWLERHGTQRASSSAA